MLGFAKKVAEKIKEEIGIQITVINPRFLTGLDIELLEKLKKKSYAHSNFRRWRTRIWIWPKYCILLWR